VQYSIEMAAFISGAAGVSPSVSDDISSAETIKGGHLTLPSVDTMFNEGAVGSRKEGLPADFTLCW